MGGLCSAVNRPPTPTLRGSSSALALALFFTLFTSPNRGFPKTTLLNAAGPLHPTWPPCRPAAQAAFLQQLSALLSPPSGCTPTRPSILSSFFLALIVQYSQRFIMLPLSTFQGVALSHPTETTSWRVPTCCVPKSPPQSTPRYRFLSPRRGRVRSRGLPVLTST